MYTVRYAISIEMASHCFNVSHPFTVQHIEKRMDVAGTNLILFLVVFVFSIQDVCIILAIIVVFLLFFNTYIFQAGLVSLLIRKFKTTIIIAVIYLALSVGLHVWTMVSTLYIIKHILASTPKAKWIK
jgi:hypothetical protein